ncbi:hypothetical protein HON52_02655 [Candidatus Uhrbacteria bacterium]|nr:hypothetical protein [Candidatus Uhrbacteria bacterium]
MSQKSVTVDFLLALGNAGADRELLQKLTEIIRRGRVEPLEDGEVSRFKWPIKLHGEYRIRDIRLCINGSMQVLVTNKARRVPELWVGQINDSNPDNWENLLDGNASYVILLGFGVDGTHMYLWLDQQDEDGQRLYLRFYDRDHEIDHKIGGRFDVDALTRKYTANPPLTWVDANGVQCSLHHPTHNLRGNLCVKVNDHSIKPDQAGHIYTPPRGSAWIEYSTRSHHETVVIPSLSFRSNELRGCVVPESVTDIDDKACFLQVSDRGVFLHYGQTNRQLHVNLRRHSEKMWVRVVGDTMFIKHWEQDDSTGNWSWALQLIRGGEHHECIALEAMSFGPRNPDPIILGDMGFAIILHDGHNDPHKIMIFDKMGERVRYETNAVTNLLEYRQERAELSTAECNGCLVIRNRDEGGKAKISVFDPFADEQTILNQIACSAPCRNTKVTDVVYVEGQGYLTVRHIGDGILSVMRFG